MIVSFLMLKICSNVTLQYLIQAVIDADKNHAFI
jgi:hypothetical protein